MSKDKLPLSDSLERLAVNEEKFEGIVNGAEGHEEELGGKKTPSLRTIFAKLTDAAFMSECVQRACACAKHWALQANKIATEDAVIATGSTEARTLPDRFSDMVNVKDFGAVSGDILKPLIVVVAGQSNAVGSSGTITDKIGYSFYWDGSESRWKTPVKNPVFPSPTGGFLPSFAKKINQEKRRPCYFINVSVAGSNCASDSHSKNGSWAANGTLRSRAEQLYNSAISALSTEFDVLGTIWIQGESDALRIENSNPEITETELDYTTTVKDTIDWMLSTFGGEVFISKIGYLQTEKYDSNIDLVNEILDAIVSSKEKVHIASSVATGFRKQWYLKDEYHYTQEAYDILGEDLANFAKEYISADITISKTGIDSTVAFLESAKNNKVVYVPEGTYRVTDNIKGRFVSFGNVLTYPVFIDVLNLSDIVVNISKNIEDVYKDNPYLAYDKSDSIIKLLSRPLIVDGIERTPDGDWDYHKFVEIGCGPKNSAKIRIHGVGNYSRKEGDKFIVDDMSDAVEVLPGTSGHYGKLAITYLADASGKENLALSQETLRCAKRVFPKTDGDLNLGLGSNRWDTIYASTGSINTSDNREKQAIQPYPDEVLDAWGEVEFRQFVFTDAVVKKGANSARLHSGIIAQQVVSAFSARGLDATRYGLLCFDKWEDEYENVVVVDSPATFDADGNEVTTARTHTEKKLVTKAGERYGIRYSEALCMEAAYQRRRADKLEQRIAAIEEKLK